MEIKKRNLLEEFDLSFARSVSFHDGAPFEQSVRRAAELGCTHYYIEGAYEDAAPNWNEPLCEERRQLSESLGVKAIFHGNYKTPIAHENAAVRRAAILAVQQEIQIAACFGAPVIVHGSILFTHRNAKGARKAYLEALADSMLEVAEFAASHNIEVWLENLERYPRHHPFYTLFSSFDDYSFVLERARHPAIRFVFDVGHENVGGGNPATIVEHFCDRIAALDLNDNTGKQDSHLALGRGNVNFGQLVATLLKHSWKGHLTLETRGSTVERDLGYLQELTRAAA